jgi:hypothetical protein
LQHYLRRAARLAGGDFMAALDSPVDTTVVEALMSRDMTTLSADQRMRRVLAYFASPYFEEVPCESISAGLFAVLKDRVKRGQDQNPSKAKDRLAGFFYDVQSVATYGPYCQAIFVDSAMWDFVHDMPIGLASAFGTRVFVRRNWDEFLMYLDSLRSRMTTELERAIQLVHPYAVMESVA